MMDVTCCARWGSTSNSALEIWNCGVTGNRSDAHPVPLDREYCYLSCAGYVCPRSRRGVSPPNLDSFEFRADPLDWCVSAGQSRFP